MRFEFEADVRGTMSRKEVLDTLKEGNPRPFALVKEYRRDAQGFSVSQERVCPDRLGPAAEAQIKCELVREKALVDDPRRSIRNYKDSALRDRLKKKGCQGRAPGAKALTRRLNDEDKRELFVSEGSPGPRDSRCLFPVQPPYLLWPTGMARHLARSHWQHGYETVQPRAHLTCPEN